MIGLIAGIWMAARKNTIRGQGFGIRRIIYATKNGLELCLWEKVQNGLPGIKERFTITLRMPGITSRFLSKYYMRPTIAVVIPVYNDKDNLKKCFASIFDSQGKETEVIIVDDGSSDRLEPEFPDSVCKLIRLPENKGQAYARNIGVKESNRDIILFTDADCILMKDWVKLLSDKLIDMHNQDSKVVAVCGRLDSENHFFAKTQAYTSYAYCLKGAGRFTDYLNTACVAVYRDAFWDVGGFSEDMRVNEDPDLALKLSAKGYKIFFEPSVFVFHNHGINTLKQFLSKQLHWGRVSGLRLDLRHKHRISFLSPLLLNPFTHCLLIFPIAFLTTLKIILFNLKSDPQIIIYAPFIFWGKIFFRWGNFISRIKGGEV